LLDERYSGNHGANTSEAENDRDSSEHKLMPKGQPDTIHVVQKMMAEIKKILGKDEDTNIFKAVNKGNENLGGAIAQHSEDNKEQFS
jgi:hypothetical protein